MRGDVCLCKKLTQSISTILFEHSLITDELIEINTSNTPPPKAFVNPQDLDNLFMLARVKLREMPLPLERGVLYC